MLRETEGERQRQRQRERIAQLLLRQKADLTEERPESIGK